MRKHTKRKVWAVKAPGLPLIDEEQRKLALMLHSSVAAIRRFEGCNTFTRTMMIVAIAMEIDGTHDKHSRTLLRTACIMLEKCAAKQQVDEATADYCRLVANWMERWINDNRLTYTGYVAASKKADILDKEIG